MTQTRFPVPKDLDSFEFDKLPVDETQLRTLYTGEFIEQQRNVVLVGGTGTGKTHLAIAIAIARQAVRSGFRARFIATSSKQVMTLAESSTETDRFTLFGWFNIRCRWRVTFQCRFTCSKVQAPSGTRTWRWTLRFKADPATRR